MTNHLLSSSTITGDDVVNTQGEDIGHIKDLMVDTQNGQVQYAVLAFGGFMGMGDKYFAVPFNQFHVDHNRKKMVLNVAKERLKDAPGFDKDAWPDFADPSFRTSIDTYYG